jgi:hypothetical protein
MHTSHAQVSTARMVRETNRVLRLVVGKLNRDPAG